MGLRISNHGSQCWGRVRSPRVFLPFLCVSFLAAGLASAEQESFAETGPYFGLSGVYTHNFFDSQVDDAFSDLVGGTVDVDIEDSAGLNARLGYRVSPFLAFELQYEWIDNIETKVSAPLLPIGNSATLDIEGHSLTANTKLIIPTWRIQPYVLLGAGYSLYDSETNFSTAFAILPGIDQLNGGKESGFAARVGAGVDLYLTPHIVVNAEITALITTQDFAKPDTGSIDNLYYLSMGAGLQYHF